MRLAAVSTLLILGVADGARANPLDPGTTHIVTEGDSDAASSYGVASAEGRFVAFESDGDLHADINGVRDVFVRDRESGSIELISRHSNGFPSDRQSGLPVMTPDGRFVAFQSGGALAEGDVAARVDVFVHDRGNGTTTLASPGFLNEELFARPSISADGATLAYQGSLGIYIWHRAAGEARRVAPHGERATLSADGTKVAFFTHLALVVEDTDAEWDVYVTDVASGAHTLVSTGFDRGAFTPAISGDGNRVAFLAYPLAQLHPVDLFVKDLGTGETRAVSARAEPYDAPAISLDGTFVAFASPGPFVSPSEVIEPQPIARPGIYGWRWDDGSIELLSQASDGTIGLVGPGLNAQTGSSNPAMSPDGRFVTFDTAERLSNGDTDHGRDVYLRDRSDRVKTGAT